jgi:hypothetical protein
VKGVFSIFTPLVMNRLIAILFFALLSACQTDLLLPCEEEGPVGNICREYRYSGGSAIGFVEYEYDSQASITSRIFDQQSNLTKTIIERFENGKTTLIAEQYPDVPSKVQTWHYNEMDSLFLIYYGFNDSTLEITFENEKRIREDYFHSDSLDRWVAYRYYEDDGKLYRKSFFSAPDSMLHYENYQYFSTGQNRISYYTPNHQLIGKRVFLFSQLGLITSIEFTNAQGAVTDRTDYIYDSAGKLSEKSRLGFNQISKSVYLYY